MKDDDFEGELSVNIRKNESPVASCYDPVSEHQRTTVLCCMLEMDENDELKVQLAGDVVAYQNDTTISFQQLIEH